MSFRKSAPLPSGPSPAGPLGMKPNLHIVAMADVVSSPERDAGKVNMLGNYILKPGAKFSSFFMTPSELKLSTASEGGELAIGTMMKVEGMHPGNDISSREFTAEWLGVQCLVFVGYCDGTGNMDVYGTECSPLTFKSSQELNNDSTNFTFTFEQFRRTKAVPGIYSGTLALSQANTPADFDLALAKTNETQQYNLPSSPTAATEIDVASENLDNNTTVSLVGAGGDNPATLANGAGTAATIILKDGTSWTALTGAVIHLKKINDGTTTFLYELSRS
jgi:hypothetical protein